MFESIFPLDDFDTETAAFFAAIHELEETLLLLAEEFGLEQDAPCSRERRSQLTETRHLPRLAA